VYLNITALNIKECYSGTTEFSAANGVHVSMDASSGSVKMSQYTLTGPDGKPAPIFAGSTTKLFLYQVGYKDGGLFMTVYNRA
jgi:hypothetical protein